VFWKNLGNKTGLASLPGSFAPSSTATYPPPDLNINAAVRSPDRLHLERGGLNHLPPKTPGFHDPKITATRNYDLLVLLFAFWLQETFYDGPSVDSQLSDAFAVPLQMDEEF
jgi:hypothetical protein